MDLEMGLHVEAEVSHAPASRACASRDLARSQTLSTPPTRLVTARLLVLGAWLAGTDPTACLYWEPRWLLLSRGYLCTSSLFCTGRLVCLVLTRGMFVPGAPTAPAPHPRLPRPQPLGLPRPGTLAIQHAWHCVRYKRLEYILYCSTTVQNRAEN